MRNRSWKYLMDKDIDLLASNNISRYSFYKYDAVLELVNRGMDDYNKICEVRQLYFDGYEFHLLRLILLNHGFIMNPITNYMITRKGSSYSEDKRRLKNE